MCVYCPTWLSPLLFSYAESTREWPRVRKVKIHTLRTIANCSTMPTKQKKVFRSRHENPRQPAYKTLEIKERKMEIENWTSPTSNGNVSSATPVALQSCQPVRTDDSHSRTLRIDALFPDGLSLAQNNTHSLICFYLGLPRIPTQA